MPFYDSFALNKPSAAGVIISELEAKNVLGKILYYKNNAKSVLEIGPGRGAFMRCTQNRNMNYVCADFSWSLLQNLPDSQRIHTLIPPIPIVENNFDIVFASNVLEHMPDFKTSLSFVKEMKRVVNSGGLICHRVPNAMAWGMHFWNGDYTHSFATTPRNVSQLYIDVGLKIEGIFPVAGPVVGYWANWISIIGKITPSWPVNHGARIDSRIPKILYSFKTTFLKGFLIVGRKIE